MFNDYNQSHFPPYTSNRVWGGSSSAKTRVQSREISRAYSTSFSILFWWWHKNLVTHTSRCINQITADWIDLSACPRHKTKIIDGRWEITGCTPLAPSTSVMIPLFADLPRKRWKFALSVKTQWCNSTKSGFLRPRLNRCCCFYDKDREMCPPRLLLPAHL